MMPFDSGHKEDVRKGKARHGRGHSKGHCVGGLVDFFPVSILSDLQCRPSLSIWQKQQDVLAQLLHSALIFIFDSSGWPRTHCVDQD